MDARQQRGAAIAARGQVVGESFRWYVQNQTVTPGAGPQRGRGRPSHSRTRPSVFLCGEGGCTRNHRLTGLLVQSRWTACTACTALSGGNTGLPHASGQLL